MDFLQVLWLGILQGITEFLPISSSAHLILAPVLAGWTDQGVAFDLAVHVGTLLAVVLYFHRDVMTLCKDSVASLGQRRIVLQGLMATYLVIGTVPAALVGLLLLDLIDSQLRSVEIIFFTTLFFWFATGLGRLATQPAPGRHHVDLAGCVVGWGSSGTLPDSGYVPLWRDHHRRADARPESGSGSPPFTFF